MSKAVKTVKTNKKVSKKVSFVQNNFEKLIEGQRKWDAIFGITRTREEIINALMEELENPD